jgi:hypothetical protein
MRKIDAIFLGLCAATAAFALVFTLAMILEWEVAWYYPTERRWEYEVKAHGLAMDFYGRCLAATVAALAAYAVTYLVGRRLPPGAARVSGLFTAWAITAVLYGVLFFGYTLYFREPIPPPVPDWYQPR